jgi:prolyl oligopeptidase
VIAPGEAVVESVEAAQDALYVTLLEAGLYRLQRVLYNPAMHPVEVRLPLQGTLDDLTVDPRIDGAIFFLTSWTDAGGYYAYDPDADTVSYLKLQPRGPNDQPPNLVAEEVLVPSYDGVPVPMSIVHPKNMPMDGNNPCILTGYGSYGMNWPEPSFDPTMLAWYEHGGIYAVADVRGGGAYGEEWHVAGQKATKPNTWKDLIACAEWLQDNHYTSSAKLAISGGSAGGITVGRALTERPDLYKVVIAHVGVLNPVRQETDPNGVVNIPEFGTVTKPDEFKGLLEMDSYHHVFNAKKYPAVLLTTGMNDPRVPPWEPAKFAAKLEQAGAPLVLLRVDYDAGHGIGSTKTQRLAETADVMAFSLWQFGDPAFQPPATTTAAGNTTASGNTTAATAAGNVSVSTGTGTGNTTAAAK